MKKLLVLLSCIFLVSLALGLEISEELDTKVLVKEYNTPIEMDLTATNASSGNYNVYTLSDIIITPAEIFSHNGGILRKTFYLKANDRLDVDGFYVFTYTLNHRDVEQVSKKITLNLLSISEVLDVSTNVIGLNDSEAILVIKNLEDINLENIEIEFSSVLFDHAETVSLGPEQEKRLTVALDPEKLKKVKAGTYLIDVTVKTLEGDVKFTGKLYLNEEKGIRVEDTSSGFLIRSVDMNKINVGNTVEDVSITIEKSIVSRLFTSFNLEPTSVERDGAKVMFTWNDRLYPSDNLRVVAQTNWLYPLLIIIAALLAYFGVKRLIEKKVEVKKRVSTVKTKGGDFALKVTVSLKSRKDVENVTLTDRISPLVKLYNKFGTIKPTKIDAHNRKIQWVVGDLAAGEERVFSYIVYSKVGVLGKFSLPAAKAVFEKNGDIQETQSNKVFFLSDQTNQG